ncbi:MAG: hypothetical protein ACKVS8_06600 [Phycisphaerales bacterium]
MRRCPRTRKAVKWGGAALCLLVGVAWAAATVPAVIYDASPAWLLGTKGGAVVVLWDPEPQLERVAVVEPHDLVMIRSFWWLYWTRDTAFGICALPLWMPLALVLIPTAVAWRWDAVARRAARLGLCARCGYDRAGLAPGAVCAECSAPATGTSTAKTPT